MSAKTMRRLCRIGILGVCLGLAPPSVAAQTSGTTPPSIRATGRATVMAEPDQVEIDLGVVTQADSSRQASTDNAARLDRVLAAIRKTVGPEATTRTVTYSVRPDYRQPGQRGGEPVITGYTATNIVRVTLPVMNQLGNVIDTAASAGANRVDRIRFTLRDPETVRRKVLAEAAVDARAQAQSLATALGVRVAGVLSASEETPLVRPFAEALQPVRLDAASAATPIESGPIEVSATVTVTMEVGVASSSR